MPLQQQPLSFNLPTTDAAAAAAFELVSHVSGCVNIYDNQRAPSTSSKRQRLGTLTGSNTPDVRKSLPSAGCSPPTSNVVAVHRQRCAADDLTKPATATDNQDAQGGRKRSAAALWHDDDDHKYARHYSESLDSQRSMGSFTGASTPSSPSLPYRRPNNKNQPRNTRSIRQRTIFYKWIIDHIDRPFPTDQERSALCIESMCKRDFNYWFSNLRHRSLECFVDEHGQKCYRPRPTFYKTCLRLGLSIPWAIPESIQCQLTNVSPRTKLARM
ncbi:hypothetical protein GGI21_003913 [Coemansia aciculifera]|nr:hypothetical protein GGI21_003913 [Coemansia aciculifera]